jgi:hypothetical protein
MKRKIKYKVFDWIINKLEKGDNFFDVSECVKDIGLNPNDKNDIEIVDKIFQWNDNKTKDYMINFFECNN